MAKNPKDLVQATGNEVEAAYQEALRSRRRMVLAVACLGMMVFAMSGQILPAALRTVGDEFRRIRSDHMHAEN